MWQDKQARLIERLFDKRWDIDRQTLTKAVVTIDDVKEVISEFNASSIAPVLGPIGLDYAERFFKDYPRNRSFANARWPKCVFRSGYTAVVEDRAGACFRFVPVEEGQAEPFPEERSDKN